MIICPTFALDIENVKREILVSAVLLQLKKAPDIQAGNIHKLYLYENWVDDNYILNLKKEHISESLKTNKYLINYGQDFGKYYLGYVTADFENKLCLDWQVPQENITSKEISFLSSSFFDPNAEQRNITIFTPTRGSDINLTRF